MLPSMKENSMGKLQARVLVEPLSLGSDHDVFEDISVFVDCRLINDRPKLFRPCTATYLAGKLCQHIADHHEQIEVGSVLTYAFLSLNPEISPWAALQLVHLDWSTGKNRFEFAGPPQSAVAAWDVHFLNPAVAEISFPNLTRKESLLLQALLTKMESK
jgi:hypothetical protein